MFRPNKTCYVTVASGRTDVYGQPLAATKVREQCAVVRLLTTNMKSAVRADSSASRGNAKELVSDSLILLAATTVAGIDDLIEVSGAKLRILSKHPRYSVGGTLDHYEITASVWS
jgi:hypothetical protein